MWGRRFRLPSADALMEPYARRLPHIHPQAAWLFVTWRLAGCLPLRRDLLLPSGQPPPDTGAAFVAMDRQTDLAQRGPKWLADPRTARIVVVTLLAGEQERQFYRLRAWVVMPNHVHVLWEPFVDMPAITRWVKGSTARQANLLLGRTGRVFWQDESYDHWVRNRYQLEKTVRYIEWNPVHAGLARTPEDWPWSSAAWQAKPPAPQGSPW